MPVPGNAHKKGRSFGRPSSLSYLHCWWLSRRLLILLDKSRSPLTSGSSTHQEIASSSTHARTGIVHAVTDHTCALPIRVSLRPVDRLDGGLELTQPSRSVLLRHSSGSESNRLPPDAVNEHILLMPRGLSSRYFRSYCSALNRSTLTDSQSSALARSVIRTF